MAPVMTRMDTPNMFSPALAGAGQVSAPQAGMVPPVSATSPTAPVQPSDYTGASDPIGSRFQTLFSTLGVPQQVAAARDAFARGDVAEGIGHGISTTARALAATTSGAAATALTPFLGAGAIGYHVLRGMFGLDAPGVDPKAAAAQAPSGNAPAAPATNPASPVAMAPIVQQPAYTPAQQRAIAMYGGLTGAQIQALMPAYEQIERGAANNQLATDLATAHAADVASKVPAGQEMMTQLQRDLVARDASLSTGMIRPADLTVQVPK